AHSQLSTSTCVLQLQESVLPPIASIMLSGSTSANQSSLNAPGNWRQNIGSIRDYQFFVVPPPRFCDDYPNNPHIVAPSATGGDDLRLRRQFDAVRFVCNPTGSVATGKARYPERRPAAPSAQLYTERYARRADRYLLREQQRGLGG